MKKRMHYALKKGFRGLLVSLAMLIGTSAFAAPGTDPITQVENYLDQIRIKIDNIQQSVDEIEEPPLAEKVVETFSFSTCASIEALAQAGGGFDLKVPVKLEGEAQPGLEVVSALVQAYAAISASLSGSLDGTAAVNATVCLDLYKLSKALIEEVELQTGEEPIGLLGNISQEARDYLLALASANPADLYNTLLEPGVDGVNEAFGFNPATITDVAYALDDEIRGSQFITDPGALLSNAEDGLGRLAVILPFAGDLSTDVSSIFNNPATLNPCTYQSDLPAGTAKDLLSDNCSAVADLESELADVVDVLDNLLLLANIEIAVELAETALNFVKNTTLVAIDELVDGLETAKDGICDVLDPVISC